MRTWRSPFENARGPQRQAERRLARETLSSSSGGTRSLSADWRLPGSPAPRYSPAAGGSSSRASQPRLMDPSVAPRLSAHFPEHLIEPVAGLDVNCGLEE